MTWNPFRIACLVGGVLAGGASFLFPPLASILTPVATGLCGLAMVPPGTKPKTPVP